MRKIIFGLFFSFSIFILNINADSGLGFKKSDRTLGGTIDVSEDVLKTLQKKNDEILKLLKQLNLSKDSHKESLGFKHVDLDKANPGVFHKLAISLKDMFKFVFDKADKLLSKKFIAATLFIIGPAIAVYCKYFDRTLLDYLFGKVAKVATNGAIEVSGHVADGIIDSISENQSTVAKVVGLWFGIETVKMLVIKTAYVIGENALPALMARLPYLWLGVKALFYIEENMLLADFFI